MKARTQVSAFAASLLCASTLLAGCGGGGAALPQAHTGTMGANKAKAAFTIHWPAHAVAASAHTTSGRKPQFISPNALAVIVEVNPNAATPGNIMFSGQPVIANNNGTATSTVSIDAPVGSDEFVFTLWDQPQTAGETQPVGNQLGQADVVQTIVANQTNNVNAVIGGITAHIGISPVPNQPFVESNTDGSYGLVGDAPAKFVAAPYDADNNVILGPGAPSLSFAANGSAGTYINVQPDSGNANQFTVNSVTPFVSTKPLSIVGTATDAGVQHTYTTYVNVYQRSAIYVSYGTSANGAPMIALYDDQGTPIPLPSGAFSGLKAPAGVAYDTKTDQVFVADSQLNAVLAFDALGNPVVGFTPPSLTGARGVAYDPQQDTLFATGTSSVIAFKADGSSAQLPAGAWSKTTTPDAIAYVGQNTSRAADDEIAIGNDATKAIDYYSYNGLWIRSASLATTTAGSPAALIQMPIVGLAWNKGINYGPSLAAGGPAGAGWAISEWPSGGFTLGNVASTTTRYGGIAISQTRNATDSAGNVYQYEGYFVLTDANQIQGYISASFRSPDILITTPASSGLSNPIGIAITAI